MCQKTGVSNWYFYSFFCCALQKETDCLPKKSLIFCLKLFAIGMFPFFASSVFPPNFHGFWHLSPENCCKLKKQPWVLTFQLKSSFNLLFYLLLQIFNYFLSSSAIMQWSFKAVHCNWKPPWHKSNCSSKPSYTEENCAAVWKKHPYTYKLDLYMKLHALDTNIGVQVQKQVFRDRWACASHR